MASSSTELGSQDSVRPDNSMQLRKAKMPAVKQGKTTTHFDHFTNLNWLPKETLSFQVC